MEVALRVKGRLRLLRVVEVLGADVVASDTEFTTSDARHVVVMLVDSKVVHFRDIHDLEITARKRTTNVA